jgi:serine/threonine-protein kinase
VWLARDASVGRDVALKELRPERVGNPTVWARFLKEAQVTGQLEHPGIVPVYEVGCRTEDKQPFYTMRFVRGRTLAEATAAYHRRRATGEAGPLELRELLTAFVGVCNAVAYAHSRGVLHRDLKPQNVILGDYGEVIVLDWGLAKLMDRPDDEAAPLDLPTDGQAEWTMQGQVLGTPAYMAPEQAEGRLDLLGPASDVHGLGAILYEILTGQPPFQGDDTTAVLRKVVHETPPRPRSLTKGTPKALEAVCLKALAKKPAARYGTAKELAADVQRWLAGEPVSACPEPRSVRLGRWLRRHRVGVAGAGAALVAAVVCLGASTGFLLAANQEARRQRQIADTQRDRAADRFRMARDAVDQFHTKVSESADLRVHALEGLRKKLLQSAADFYGKLVQGEADDANVRAEHGIAYIRLASLSTALGDTDGAIRSGRAAQSIFEQLLSESPEEPNYEFELASVHGGLAMTNRDQGKNQDAEAEWKIARDILNRLIEREPANREYQGRLAICLGNLGMSAYMRNDQLAAEQLLLEELKLRESDVRAEPENEGFLSSLADVNSNLGLTYTAVKRVEKAEQAFRLALDIKGKLYKGHPHEPEYQLDYGRNLNNLANLYSSMAQPRKAREVFDQALAVHEQLVKEHPLVLEYQSNLAVAHYNQGDTCVSMGELEIAERMYRQAEADVQYLLRVQPVSSEYQAILGGVEAGQALVLAEQGKAKEALERYTQAMDRLKDVLHKEPNHLWATGFMTDALLGRAQALGTQGRHAAAQEDLQEAVKFGQSPEEPKYRIALAMVLARAGDSVKATAEADAAAKDTALVPRNFYALGAVYALATLKDSAQALKSLRMLERARDAGYFQNKATAKRLSQDSDFASIRGSNEFTKLLVELEKGH